MPTLSLRVDWVHVHILINHFPVILAVAGALAVLYALVRPRRGIWLYGVVSLTLAAITVIPAFLTGKQADEALGDPWYVAESAIHAHEEAAEMTAIIVLLAGVAAAVAWRRLVRYPREVSMPRTLRTAVLVTALAAAGVSGYTALLGGRIVHEAPGLQGRGPAGRGATGAAAAGGTAAVVPTTVAPAPVAPGITPDTARPIADSVRAAAGSPPR